MWYLLSFLAGAISALVILNQIHSSKIKALSAFYEQKIADALVKKA